jgi:hypothetical protein
MVELSFDLLNTKIYSINTEWDAYMVLSQGPVTISA